MTAMVIDGETRQSLCAVRALGRAQIPVAVSAKKRPALALWSRYARSTFLMEDPSSHARVFAEHLGEEIRARSITCVLPSSDDALWAISRFRDVLPEAACRILPPHYSVVRVLDHEALYHFADSLGVVCVPLVRVPHITNERDVLASIKGLPFPLLIRPIIPWSEREEGGERLAKRMVRSKAELFSRIHAHHDYKHGFLASAYPSSLSIAYFGVADKGAVIVDGFQERLKEFQPYGEVVLARTVEGIASVKTQAQSLIHSLQWQGPFKVEFIRDGGGRYRLVSVVGRLWSSLLLALKAGCNIPLVCYRMAEGSLGQTKFACAQPHVRMRWLLGDIAATLAHPSVMSQGLGSSLKQVFSRRPKARDTSFYDAIDLDDPMPFFFELQQKTYKRALGQKLR